MRGDMRSNCNLQSDGVLQPDSSSSSSSPRSNSSHDDDILEVRGPDFMPKPIYNFSIPDVIKHEPRVERHENNDRLDNDTQYIQRSCRKRNHTGRHMRDNIACSYDETPITIRSKRQRRSIAAAAAAAENVITDNDRDDDCHHRPPVIDLTEIDSHDEYHSDSEINDTSLHGSRPLTHIPHESFSSVLSDLQLFRQQLQDSRNAGLLLRSSSIRRLQRLRRRTARPNVTDSPATTDDMDFRTPEPITVSTPEMTSADDSVMVINEVRGNQQLLQDDHTIALRMANDPTYSPPYHSPLNPSPLHHRSLSRLTRSDESFNQFQERIRSIRQRSRERLEQARRIGQEAQERLARIHDSINSLRHGRSPAGNTTNSSENSSDNNSDSENRNTGDLDNSTDDVEIIHEWNPRNMEYLQAPINVLSPLPPSFHSSMQHLNRRHLPMPDFLRPLMSTFLSPLPPAPPPGLSGLALPPRLHHLHHIQEDYEALLNLAERIGPAKPRGLTKAEIDLIPSFRFSSSTAKETNTKCIICMNEYTNREKLRRLPCTHDFHSKCIDKWLRSNKTCPICRDEMGASSD